MTTVHLTIGNRCCSSWSLRGWLAMRLQGRAASAETLLSWPSFREWEVEAALETHVIANPQVLCDRRFSLQSLLPIACIVLRQCEG